MRTLIAFVIGGAATWVLRIAFITLVPHSRIPSALTRSLRHAAPAAFGALVAVSVHGAATGDSQIAGWPVVAATAVTLVVALRTRHLLFTLATGSAAVTVFTLL